MAYAYQAIGTTATGTTSLSVAYPASPAAGDLLLLCVSSHNAAVSSVPGVWTAVPSAATSKVGGSGSLGTIYSDVYYKVADGTESGSIAVGVSGAQEAIAVIVDFRPGTASSTPDFSSGHGTANGALGPAVSPSSLTFSPNPDVTNGDVFLTSQASEVGTGITFSATSLNGSGVTISAASERLDSSTDQNANSDVAHLLVNTFTLTSGTATNTPLAYTTTGSSSFGTGTAFAVSVLRIRERPLVFRRSDGNTAVGTTSLSVPYPSVISAGDRLVLVVASKYTANDPATPAGWTLKAQIASSGGSAGSDAGNVTTTLFVKDATGSETGTETVTITSGNSAIGRMWAWGKPSGYAWSDHVQSVAGQGASSTALSFALSTDWTLAQDDVVIGILGAASDARTFTAEAFDDTAHRFASTSMTERQDSGTNQGDDCGLTVWEQYVATSGTTSSFTASATASSSAASTNKFALIAYHLTASPLLGTASTTLADFSVSSTAVAPVKGAASPALASLTVSGTGISKTSAAASPTLAAFTTTATAVSPIAATCSVSCASATISAAAVTPIHATIAVSLATTTLVATAISKISAAAALTTANATTSATATSRVSGSVAVTTATATTVATAKSIITAGVSKTLDEVTASATGALLVAASATISTADATASATATVLVAAQASITLADATCSGSSASVVAADVAVTLADVTVSADGAAGVDTAAAGITLDDVTASIAGVSVIVAETSAALDDATISASAKVLVVAQAAVTIDDAVIEASASVPVAATVDVTLSDITGAGTASAEVHGTISVTLEDFTAIANSAGGAAFGNCSLDDVIVSCQATAPASAASTLALEDATSSAQAKALVQANVAMSLTDVVAASSGQALVQAAAALSIDAVVSGAATAITSATVTLTLDAFACASEVHRRASVARFKVTDRKGVAMEVRLLMRSLYVGDVLQIEVEILDDETDAPVNPSALSFRIKRRPGQDGAETVATEYVFGTDPEIEQISSNKFRASIPCDEDGDFDYTWISPGPAGKGVQPGYFYVNERPAA